ncbi:hypothetical protein COO60DRAFT_636728 [Scenedesmus sp. NREL 46B-D3]|nr:hypothetical protein COO60DRAFT_636728 [Scenedesmus sp. NREL 46B-D3]
MANCPGSQLGSHSHSAIARGLSSSRVSSNLLYCSRHPSRRSGLLCRCLPVFSVSHVAAPLRSALYRRSVAAAAKRRKLFEDDPTSSSEEHPSRQQQQQQRTPQQQQQPARPAAAAAAAKLEARVRRLKQLEASGQISSPFLADVFARKMQQDVLADAADIVSASLPTLSKEIPGLLSDWAEVEQAAAAASTTTGRAKAAAAAAAADVAAQQQRLRLVRPAVRPQGSAVSDGWDSGDQGGDGGYYDDDDDDDEMAGPTSWWAQGTMATTTSTQGAAAAAAAAATTMHRARRLQQQQQTPQQPVQQLGRTEEPGFPSLDAAGSSAQSRSRQASCSSSKGCTSSRCCLSCV